MQHGAHRCPSSSHFTAVKPDMCVVMSTDVSAHRRVGVLDIIGLAQAPQALLQTPAHPQPVMAQCRTPALSHSQAASTKIWWKILLLNLPKYLWQIWRQGWRLSSLKICRCELRGCRAASTCTCRSSRYKIWLNCLLGVQQASGIVGPVLAHLRRLSA